MVLECQTEQGEWIQCPLFSGKHLETWIIAIQLFFHQFDIPAEMHVNLSSHHIIGLAEKWVVENEDRIAWMNWCTFVEALMSEFEDSQCDIQTSQHVCNSDLCPEPIQGVAIAEIVVVDESSYSIDSVMPTISMTIQPRETTKLQMSAININGSITTTVTLDVSNKGVFEHSLPTDVILQLAFLTRPSSDFCWVSPEVILMDHRVVLQCGDQIYIRDKGGTILLSIYLLVALQEILMIVPNSLLKLNSKTTPPSAFREQAFLLFGIAGVFGYGQAKFPQYIIDGVEGITLFDPGIDKISGFVHFWDKFSGLLYICMATKLMPRVEALQVLSPPVSYSEMHINETKKNTEPSYAKFSNGSQELYILNAEPAKTGEAFSLPMSSNNQYMKLESDGHLNDYQWDERWLSWLEPFDLLNVRNCRYPLVCGTCGICSNGKCKCCPRESCKQACFKNCSCKAAFFLFRGNDLERGFYLQPEILSLVNDEKLDSWYKWLSFIKVQSASAATWSAAPQPSSCPHHQPTTLEEIRTLWTGDLQFWVDENYLNTCFAHTNEVLSIKIICNKITSQPEGYRFVGFTTHAAAERILQTYNGTLMPGTEQTFRLNWASFGIRERRPETGPEHSIFVGDLALDVTDYVLQKTFRVQYPSVRGAKVVNDPNTGRSKGYGFVKFQDEMEGNRVMSEMNGVYCSTRPMCISAATPKKATGFQQPQQQYTAAKAYPAVAAAYTTPAVQQVPAVVDNDINNTTIFVGGLDANIAEEELRQIFASFGEIVYVNIPQGKGCGFVQFAARPSAEDAIQRMNGTVIGQQTIRVSWGKSMTTKQDQTGAWAQTADPFLKA